MNLEVARSNYEVLKTLPSETKLRVEHNGKLIPEDRWFTSGRRYWEQTSKMVLKPINDTFVAMQQEPDAMEVFANTEQKLKKLYPDNNEIKELLNNISALFVSPIDNTAVAPTALPEEPAETEPTEPPTAVEPTPNIFLEEEAYVVPLRKRQHHSIRYEVVSGDVILDMGDESYIPNADEDCCLVKWIRDLFKSPNQKHD